MKKIILAVGSSISAYKTCDLARMFVKTGYDVFTVLTDNATKLVSPLALKNLTGHPVYTDEILWIKREKGHLSLRDNAALFLAAPATVDMLGKFANGIADDLVSTTFLSVKCPVLIAPAMNPGMYSHPAVQFNIEKLKRWGYKIVEPVEGIVVCGDQGKRGLADINIIYETALCAIEGENS